MEFGLKENIVSDIKHLFTSFPEVDEVVLYGSRAKGNYKPGSDTDLAVKGDNINVTLLNKISLKLDDLYLPYMFDLAVYKYIDNPGMVDHINRVGISIYRKHTV